jgi:alpha-tubulin suppressor-like RCC1 family protein
MLRHTRGRRLRQALIAALLPLSVAGCDQLLVEPAAMETSIALSLSPTSPSFAVAPGTADSIRVQVLTEGANFFDQKFAFDPSVDEIVIPVRFTGTDVSVSVMVEVSQGSLPLLRGSNWVRLVQRRVIELEGIYHTCGVGDYGLKACWGMNDEGQLGTLTGGLSPIAVGTWDYMEMYSISGGLVTTCGIAGEGEGYCWGSNRFGGLGYGNQLEYSQYPVEIAGDLTFSQISVGGLHACGLTLRGEVYCWGYNRWGQLGDGTTTTRFTPVAVATERSFSSISSGYAHTCGVAGEAGVYCWGLNNFGQLGDGTTTDRLTPTRVSTGEFGLWQVDAGGLHTCALSFNNEGYCWGFNALGQLGNNTTQNSNLPQPVGRTFESIDAGGLHTCGIGVESTRAWCWGYNRSGAVGDGTTTDRWSPVQVAGSHGFSQVAAGLHHTCGLTVDRNVLCWGYNRFGQVGDGTKQNRLLPSPVLIGDNFFYYFDQRQQYTEDFSDLLGSLAETR